MANGGIIGPVQTTSRGDYQTVFTSSGNYCTPGHGPGTASVLVVSGGGGGGERQAKKAVCVCVISLQQWVKALRFAVVRVYAPLSRLAGAFLTGRKKNYPAQPRLRRRNDAPRRRR